MYGKAQGNPSLHAPVRLAARLASGCEATSQLQSLDCFLHFSSISLCRPLELDRSLNVSDNHVHLQGSPIPKITCFLSPLIHLQAMTFSAPLRTQTADIQLAACSWASLPGLKPPLPLVEVWHFERLLTLQKHLFGELMANEGDDCGLDRQRQMTWF